MVLELQLNLIIKYKEGEVMNNTNIIKYQFRNDDGYLRGCELSGEFGS